MKNEGLSPATNKTRIVKASTKGKSSLFKDSEQPQEKKEEDKTEKAEESPSKISEAGKAKNEIDYKKLEYYLNESGLTLAFNVIFSELISKRIEPKYFFMYTEMRLKQIGKEFDALKLEPKAYDYDKFNNEGDDVFLTAQKKVDKRKSNKKTDNKSKKKEDKKSYSRNKDSINVVNTLSSKESKLSKGSVISKQSKVSKNSIKTNNASNANNTNTANNRNKSKNIISKK